jgi:ribonuclease HII
VFYLWFTDLFSKGGSADFLRRMEKSIKMKLIMQNEPNFSKSQMFINLISTTNYNKKSTMDTWSKRTQTKPILKDVFLKIILQFWAVMGKITGLLVQFPWKGVTRMVVLAGIDEAGFGPILGPLVVSSSAFSLPNHFLAADLWQILRKSVGNTRKHLAGRLLITDSKKAYSKQKGIRHLQRTVLACLECLGKPAQHMAGKRPTTLTGLLTLLSPDSIGRLGDYPWHRDIADYRLSVDAADLAIATTVLKEDLASNGIELLELRSRCLDVAYYNKMVGSVKNKSNVLFTAVSQLIKNVFDNSESDYVQVIVDRQGGRTRYRRNLQRMFPDMELKILREGSAASSYELKAKDKQMRLHFVVGADQRFLPVSLASMVSKYIRELLVDNMNRYFTELIPELKPTAGYWKDGLRFIEDLKKTPHVTFDSGQLVRCR